MIADRFGRLRLALAGTAFALAAAVFPAQAHDHHDAHDAPGYARKAAAYRLPEATLVRADGSRANFPSEIDDGKPVILNFVFTTCTAICPVLSQSFAEFQRLLGTERNKVRMVSISIDPEEDTPERLAAYAKRFGAGRQWDFYTGSVQASVALQKAFQTYFGDKMHHRPMTFMRAAPGEAWVRLEGFATPGELLKEYRRLVAAR
ncbi:MAG: SCO family protein [Betaproteobacteria bacterium]|nr:SCO family protein [Betaproteobacteria bacterium]MBI2959061.1 SCO family protein [Betaproteobacteria bacterium]